MTNSQAKQQKLYQLLQDNNLQLSLADLIEFTYHQWEDDYLSTTLAAEHISDSRRYRLDLNSDNAVFDLMNQLQLVGWALTKAHKE